MGKLALAGWRRLSLSLSLSGALSRLLAVPTLFRLQCVLQVWKEKCNDKICRVSETHGSPEENLPVV